MLCTKCGSSNPDQASFCRSCGNALEAGAPTPSGAQTTGSTSAAAAISSNNYAGFWLRFAALFLDGIILSLISFPVAFIVGLLFGISGAQESNAMIGIVYLMLFAVSATYFTLMESSEKGATLGKRAVNIRVVDMQGNRISKGKAFARWVSHALSYITLYVGFLMQPFTAKKQALHDMVSGTVVVKTEGKSSGATVAIVIAVFAFFVMIAVVGILAAIAIPAYQDYVSKAKVVRAVSVGEAATVAFEGYYIETGRIPASIDETHANIPSSPDISDLSINPDNGEIVITLSESLSSAIAGKHISMMPSQADNGHLTWQCSSDIRETYLPKQCK